MHVEVDRVRSGRPYCSEFVGTSISSGGNGVDFPANGAVLLAANPHIEFVNTLRGYVVCETRQQWRSSYRTVPSAVRCRLVSARGRTAR